MLEQSRQQPGNPWTRTLGLSALFFSFALFHEHSKPVNLTMPNIKTSYKPKLRESSERELREREGESEGERERGGERERDLLIETFSKGATPTATTATAPDIATHLDP